MLQRILLILAILAGVGVIALSQMKLREHIQGIINQRETNAKEREQQRARATTAEKNLASTSNRLVTTQGELTKTKDNLAKTSADLETTTSARDKALADLSTARDSEKAMSRQMEQWRQTGLTPEKVKQTIADLKEATNTIAVVEEEKKILGRQIAKLTNELARYYSPDDDYVAPVQKGLSGKILVVDPKWEFVVLNIGDSKGVLKDGVAMVHRDSKLVGKVKITSVLADRSIANVLAGWKLDEIREGDQVLF
ncbi:MAG: hypothetical protein HZA90_19590 [Verrucomicrobia bacterium]|nr:hypothetical protein [Verrucomicrobiota bacterium]